MSTHELRLAVSKDLHEDVVWRDFASPLLQDLPENVITICHHGFTEILNNVVDHSESSSAHVIIERLPEKIMIMISDGGVGIFSKIRRAYGLETEQEAIIELAKGKLTTDPERHTGEGIFFTAHMFDEFSILSGQAWLHCRAEGRDWSLEVREAMPGTRVTMELAPDSRRTTKDVFDRFSTDRISFDRTIFAIDLAQPNGDTLVSRSQAKRVLARLQRFKEVVLDFEGVKAIGPAFADEIFRVFANAHPEVKLSHANAHEDVKRMIEKAVRERSAGERQI